MTREELIKNVALKMDEISSSNDVIVSVVDSSDNNPLYAQINDLLNESINDVLMKAPVYRIQGHIKSINTGVKTEGIFDNTRKIAIFSVPSSFLRFVSIKDNALQRSIVDLAVEGDSVDNRQRNKFLVAKSSKPVAVIRSIENGRTITCYSYDSNVPPAPKLLYVERFSDSKEMSATVNIDGYVADVVTWACAGKVFAAQGDINRSKVCDENASALML